MYPPPPDYVPPLPPLDYDGRIERERRTRMQERVATAVLLALLIITLWSIW